MLYYVMLLYHVMLRYVTLYHIILYYNSYIKGWLDEDNTNAMHGIHNIKTSFDCFAPSHFTAAKSLNVRLNSMRVPEGEDLPEYTCVQRPRQRLNMTWLSKQLLSATNGNPIHQSNSQWLE
jgi:hypothetical protein